MQQQFRLGQYLRKTYGNFIREEFFYKEVSTM